MSEKYQVWLIAQATRNEQLAMLCVMALAVLLAYGLINLYPAAWQRYAKPLAQLCGLVVFIVTLLVSAGG